MYEVDLVKIMNIFIDIRYNYSKLIYNKQREYYEKITDDIYFMINKKESKLCFRISNKYFKHSCKFLCYIDFYIKCDKLFKYNNKEINNYLKNAFCL